MLLQCHLQGTRPKQKPSFPAGIITATADDLKEYVEKVENILQEGVIPAVNKVNELIKNPPTYNTR